jgi:O-antigen/teichoic acid export membrane protein
MVRFWIPEDYGLYRQLILLGSLVIPFASFGLDTSPFYFIPKINQDNQKQFVIQTWIWQFIGALVIAVGVFVLSNPIAGLFGDLRLDNLIKVYSLFILSNFYRSTQYQILVAMQFPIKAISLNLLTALFKPVTIAIGALFGVNLSDLIIIISIFAVFQFCIFVFIILKSNYENIAKWKFDKSLVSSQMRYSLPLYFSTTLERITRVADQAIVAFFFDTSDFAFYSVGTIRLPVVGFIIQPIIDAVKPRLSRLWSDGKKEQMVHLWHEAVRRNALIVLPLIVVAIILAEPFLVILFTDQYTDSVLPFRITLVGISLRIFATGGIILVTSGRSKYIATVQSLMIIPTIVFGYFFSVHFGWYGPALGAVVALFLREILYLLGAIKIFERKFSEVLPWKDLLNILLVACLVIPVIMPVLMLNLENVFLVLLFVLIYLVIFVCLGVIAKIITDKDIALLRSYIDRLLLKFR